MIGTFAFGKLKDQCHFCKHISGLDDDAYCKAFDNAPDDLYLGIMPHNEPYTGDNGTMYEPNPEIPLELFQDSNLPKEFWPSI